MDYRDSKQESLTKRRRLADDTEEDVPSPGTAHQGATHRAAPVKSEPKPEPELDSPERVDFKRLKLESASSDDVVDYSFDYATFEAFVGSKVPIEVVNKIRQTIGSNDVQAAVNAYFDGNWKDTPPPPGKKVSVPFQQFFKPGTPGRKPNQLDIKPEHVHSAVKGEALEGGPLRRYIGAFGVAAWATTSGYGLIQHGSTVNIERVKMRSAPKRGRQKEDILTRILVKGRAVGRLPQETAEWVSTLVDQGICDFEGVCVFAPDRIRVNDTIYLQLRCFLMRTAFQKPQLTNARDTDGPRLFDTQETAEEKLLRQRQIALIKLFSEMGVEPTSANQTGAQRRKEDLLRAAEMSDQPQPAKSAVPSTQGNKTPGSPSDEEEGEKLEQDQLDSLYKKAQVFDFNTPEAEPPDTFALELRRYQKQALHWMLGKENDVQPQRQQSMHPLWEEYTWPTKDMDDNPLPSVPGRDKFYVNPYSGELSLEFPMQEQHCLGGILADEMGLGKTIEMMSLIHTHRLNREQVEKWTGGRPFSAYSPTTVTPAPYTTLVVAPMSLLSQWENEALVASQAGSVKVRIYYGNNRIVDLRRQCYDRNDAPDVIITSYGVVLSEYGEAKPGDFISGLFSVNFLRVILDEAHLIKNRASKTAKACYDLNAVHRWALTGTPIVNRLEDLYSLVRYLRVEPWSDFSFWRTFITVPFESKDFAKALNVVQTVLEPLVLRRTKAMKTPDGKALVSLPPRTVNVEYVELSKDEREIYDLIFGRAKRTFNENVAAGTLLKSYTTIFAQILRLRQVCCHPILTRNREIVADEEDAAAAADATNEFQDDMDLQTLIDRFTAGCDAADATQGDRNITFTTSALKQIQDESSGECPICAEEPMIDPVVTPCWHSACKECIEKYIRHQTDRKQHPRCPVCREEFSPRDTFEIIRHSSSMAAPYPLTQTIDNSGLSPPPASQPPRISLRRVHPLSPSTQTSAKISSLISHLTQLPPSSKAVVFSQFTSFLDLIGPRLKREGINFVRLDGTMAQKDRAAVLAEFNATEQDYIEEKDDIDSESYQFPKPPKTKIPMVLLISLRAGGVGLNLTTANHVFMMDPWWSYAVESQAIDRVHRMGQMRQVHVTRFIVQHSIEERMLRIQERKKKIAGSLGLRLGGEGEEERRHERIEELRLLFE